MDSYRGYWRNVSYYEMNKNITVTLSFWSSAQVILFVNIYNAALVPY